MVAGQLLARFSITTSARAAVLTQGDELLASAGQLGPTEILELARLARESWPRFERQDVLLRYACLVADGPVYLLYSLSAPGGALLSLAFPSDTPLGVIRRQARELAQALPPQLAQSPASLVAKSPLDSPVGLPMWLETLAAYPPLGAEEGPKGDSPTETEHRPRNGPEQGGPSVRAGDWQPQPLPVTGALDAVPQTAEPQTRAAESPPTAGELLYALVLAPKLPEYRLEGKLAVRLEELLRSYALAFHWRVVQLEVGMRHVLTVVGCPADVAPKQIVGRLKRLTSKTLFNEFSQLLGRDPSRDFWAPGSLLATTGQVPGPGQIAEWVASVRRLQRLPD